MSGPPPPHDPANDNQSMQGGIISASVVMVAISGTLVAFRVYTRTHLLRYFGPEDITICIALVSPPSRAHAAAGMLTRDSSSQS